MILFFGEVYWRSFFIDLVVKFIIYLWLMCWIYIFFWCIRVWLRFCLLRIWRSVVLKCGGIMFLICIVFVIVRVGCFRLIVVWMWYKIGRCCWYNILLVVGDFFFFVFEFIKILDEKLIVIFFFIGDGVYLKVWKSIFDVKFVGML